jgi:hypothetical protein
MLFEINIGGQLRPLKFGMIALYAYEKRTGRNAEQDFAKQSYGAGNITLLVDITYSGLECGYRTQKKEIDFDEFTVADWLSEPGVIENVIEAMYKSLPTAEDGDEKKSKPQAKSRTLAG